MEALKSQKCFSRLWLVEYNQILVAKLDNKTKQNWICFLLSESLCLIIAKSINSIKHVFLINLLAIPTNFNLISHAGKTTQKTRVSTWSLKPPCRKLTDNGSRLHTMFRQLLFQIFISQICHLHFLCARFVCLFGCFLQNDLSYISQKSQLTLLQSIHIDAHGIISDIHR